ncbi:outer membrane protein assembly factor BamB family protein [Haloarchaeobius iranensis]|uniref:Outer membrane protein assembly factor BamB, contains PQQ-like beta-propeller repeat n=1 Tax=Haloarchaeobius iranensis TaxID=996166 RepID=A0A1G9UMW5_9EURY|nr:PQQ-binding-like beta-propeller repeat protein [Haloarchaeobius iranensis]SDM61249.1 Outer membrane protein assembly factor BamB, contains PQQ-like beta-propeller repeat [Haloarchaeobius iranensis]
MKRRRLLRSFAAAGTLATLGGCSDIGSNGDDAPGVGRAEGCGPYDPTVEGTTEWRSVCGDPAGTGVVPTADAPAPPLSHDWSFPIDGVMGTTRPVVADGRVYTHDLDTNVYCVDAATGDEVWSRTPTDPQGSPAVGEDAVIVPSGEHVLGLDPASGETLWTGPAVRSTVFAPSPVVHDGVAYVPYGLSLYAIDAVDGTTLWEHTTGHETTGTPAVSDGTVYYGDEDTYVYALDAATGAEQWRYKTDGHLECNAAVADGLVCTATRDGEVLCLDATTGDRHWAYAVDSQPEVVGVDGAQTYVGTQNRLYAFDLRTGTACWSTGTYAGRYGSGLSVGDSRAYVSTGGSRNRYNGSPAVLDVGSGRTRWTPDERDDGEFALEMGPVVVDGAVYATGGGAQTLQLVRLS